LPRTIFNSRVGKCLVCCVAALLSDAPLRARSAKQAFGSVANKVSPAASAAPPDDDSTALGVMNPLVMVGVALLLRRKTLRDLKSFFDSLAL